MFEFRACIARQVEDTQRYLNDLMNHPLEFKVLILLLGIVTFFLLSINKVYLPVYYIFTYIIDIGLPLYKEILTLSLWTLCTIRPCRSCRLLGKFYL